jgi:hypothetical protein
MKLRCRLPLLAMVAVSCGAVGSVSAVRAAPASFARRVAAGRDALERGAFAEAESLGRALLADAEARRGPSSLETADALDIVCEAMARGAKARSPELLPLARRAVAIRRVRGGPWRIERDPGLTILARALTAASRDD